MELKPRALKAQKSTSAIKKPAPANAKFSDLFIYLSLAVITLIAYNQVFFADFLQTWDDNVYVLNNPRIQELSISNVTDIFTKQYNGEYIPVVHLSFMIDHLIWKESPAPYHAINLIYHILNVFLLFWVIRRLQGSLIIGLVTALLFAVHPINVETVAWVSQRKNLLAMFFFLIALAIHMSNDKRDNILLSIGAWGFFALSILSKPAAMLAFPIFALYDFFQPHLKLPQMALRNVGYLALGLIGAILAYFADNAAGGIESRVDDDFITHILVSGRIYLDYLVSIIYPYNLDVLYVYELNATKKEVLTYLGVLLILLVPAIFGAAALFIRSIRANALLIGLWLLVFWLPISNLIVPFNVMRSDKSMYFMAIGVFLLAGILFDWVWTHVKEFRYAGAALSGGAIGLLMLLSLMRVDVWENDESLWLNHLEGNPNGYTGHIRLSSYYLSENNLDASQRVLESLVRHYPNDLSANFNMAEVAYRRQDYPTAILFYAQAMSVNPDENQDTELELRASLGLSYFQLGVEYFEQGDYARTLQAYRIALELIPNFAPLHNNIGYTLYSVGQNIQAIRAYQEAIRLEPNYALAWLNLGYPATEVEDFTLAAQAYVQGLNLGATLDAQGNSNLCLALAEIGQNQQVAIDACTQAITLEPTNALFFGRAAHVLLIFGLPEQALPIAQRATELTPPTSLAYRTLGDSLAALGRVDEARAAYEQALFLNPSNEQALSGLNAINQAPSGGQ